MTQALDRPKGPRPGPNQAGKQPGLHLPHRQPPNAAQQAKDAFAEGIDIVTFTSLSTVHNLLSLLEHKEALSASPAVCIGPITSGTARKLGPRNRQN